MGIVSTKVRVNRFLKTSWGSRPELHWLERGASPGAKMTFLYQDPLFLEHETGAHPECAERLRRISRHLQATGLDVRCQRPDWEPADIKMLAGVHEEAYISAVKQFAEAGGGRIEVDTMVSPRSYQAASLAAGAVCDAVARVIGGEDTSALCLGRPPGHHALRRAPMGFCLFNNIAVAARQALQEHGLNRLLIVDWDVHHGNGTQDAFWTDGQVGFLSIHRFPFYPGSGNHDETGSGKGLGWTRNLPMPFGVSRSDYLKAFGDALEEFSGHVKPELILLSAGFDSHRLDPVGSLGLEAEDFGALTDIVLDAAERHCQSRLVSVLEGGYNVDLLPACVDIHLRHLLQHDSTDDRRRES